MVAYKLTYFEGRGAGEIIRQILVFAEQEFEDNRLTDEQWAQFKPATPFGQLPLLTVDGKPVPQSHAAARYLARIFKINGKDEWEEAMTNGLADQFKDYKTAINPYYWSKLGEEAEGDKETLQKDFFAAIEKHFQFFANYLKAAGSGFLVGSSLTWVDLLLAQHVADLLTVTPEVFEGGKFADILEHSKRIQSTPQIKKWIEKRPKSDW